eukprot:9108561-Heterocapsa_arctica.AAC.1
MEGGPQPDINEIVEQIIEAEVVDAKASPSEPVNMKKPRAKAKPKEPSNTKEDIMEAVKEATQKTVPDKIDKNKEM